MRRPTWREYRVLDALMHLDRGAQPLTVSTLAEQARLEVEDAEQAVDSLVAMGFLDLGAVPWVVLPRTSPH